MLRKIYDYIKNHFFLRNITIALCMILIVTYLISVVLNIYTRHGQKYEVPNFVGVTIAESSEMLEDADLKLEVVDSLFVPGRRAGEILDQSPDPGMTVKSGRNIFVVINAERPRMEIVPYVTGYSLRQAKNLLETRGFVIKRLRYVEDVATNNVIDESIDGKPVTAESRIKAELGSSVDLVVGHNPSSPLPIVPKVIGLSLREAQSRLWEIGLNIGRIESDGTYKNDNIGNAKVWKQVPNQQERVMYGTSVTLYLTTDASRIMSGSKASDEMVVQADETDSTLVEQSDMIF